jgi:hypothetical protein
MSRSTELGRVPSCPAAGRDRGPDLDAEHDPEASRRASLAGLHRHRDSLQDEEVNRHAAAARESARFVLDGLILADVELLKDALQKVSLHFREITDLIEQLRGWYTLPLVDAIWTAEEVLRALPPDGELSRAAEQTRLQEAIWQLWDALRARHLR